jgi:hypothetical protein
MKNHVSVELEFFNQVEPELMGRGRYGYYIVIHDHSTLAEGKDADEAMRELLAKFERPPEPLLVRQVLGVKRKSLSMRSPKRANAPR